MSNRNILMDTTENMVRNGHLVSSATFQQLMGWASQQTVQAGLTEKRIFSMALDGEHYFPSFFADSAYDVKQLSAVTKTLGDLPGGAKMQFFVSKKGSLRGKTTLEALAAGQFVQVMRSAAAFAEN